jgi:hypothetical protein
MTVSSDSENKGRVLEENDYALHSRIFRSMMAATAMATIVAAVIAPWRIASGLLLGGILAVLSHSWLKSSATAAINLSIGSEQPGLKPIQFLLRYLVIASVVIIASQLKIVSVPAVLFGLSTFVVALLIEALREFYIAIIRREETN